MDRAAIGLVVAGVLGALISAYLTVTHYTGGTLACVNAGLIDCESVTTSSYSLIPFTEIPVALAGVLWSAAVAAGGVLALRSDPPWLRPALLLSGVLGAAFALYLINAEITVIGRICSWCTVLHALIFATLFLAIARMR